MKKRFKSADNFFTVVDVNSGVEEIRESPSDLRYDDDSGVIHFYYRKNNRLIPGNYTLANVVNGDDSDNPFGSLALLKAYLDGIISGTPSVVNYSDALITEKITLSSAQIKALGTTPIEVVSAPGAGKIHNVISLTARLNYGTAAYVGAYSIVSKVGAGKSTHRIDTGALAKTADEIFRGEEYYSGTGLDVTENAKIFVTTENADDFTTGDGTVDIYVTYETITL